MKCPCKGCERHTLTCRQFCEEHRKWKEEHEQANERRRAETDVTNYRVGVMLRIRGRKRR